VKKLILCILFLILFSPNALATGQAPDVLFYDNKIYDLFSNPLEPYYKNEKDRPAFKISPDALSSTGNWRGYVAYWEIEGDRLYLRGIDAWVCTFQEFVKNQCKKADLKELFGEKCVNGKVEANWFSGELNIPDGKRLEYVHMGYGSVYEREIILTVESGKVAKKRVVDNTNKKLPSNQELQRKELEKLRQSPTGKRKNG
jgi:hypothetical protein